MKLTDKIANHFKLGEFTKTEVTEYQANLIKVLAGQLEMVRYHLNMHPEFKRDKNKDISISISSGIRTLEDYDRLKAKGYNPSKTSDHFCGNKPGTLGAADCSFSNLNIKLFDVFKFIARITNNGDVHFGQVLYESNPKTGSEWIHLSNDAQYLFKVPYLADSVTRKLKYGYSKDNGVTFTKYEVT